jgi:hypothetical protein
MLFRMRLGLAMVLQVLMLSDLLGAARANRLRSILTRRVACISFCLRICAPPAAGDDAVRPAPAPAAAGVAAPG